MKRAKRILACILAMVVILVTVPVSISAEQLPSGRYEDLFYSIDETEGTVTIINCADTIPNRVTEVVIPSDIEGYPVTKIGDNAFKDEKSLKSVTIPDTVTSMGEGAFENCTALASVAIPGSITLVNGHAFKGCTQLETVVLGNGVEEIAAYAFQNKFP